MLNNNFIKTNNKNIDGYIILTKNIVKKTKNFIKICVEIIEYKNGGNYVIKIIGNYRNYNLKNGELYFVSLNLLNNCDIQIWNNYYKYIEDSKKIESEKNFENFDNLSLDSENGIKDNDLNDDKEEFIDINSLILDKHRERSNSY